MASLMSTSTRLLTFSVPKKPARCCTCLRKRAIDQQRRGLSSAPQLGMNATSPNLWNPPARIEEKDWEFDDLPSAGHAELEQHREARRYARIAAYEMPRLARLARPFTPPSPKQALRFRYTTYLGEKHPAESKVVMEFSAHDPALNLKDIQRDKLIKLCGARYNPESGIIKIASEMFDQQAQNKRYLSDLLDRLLIEAMNPADTFEDIPIDLRHYKKKWKNNKPKFPKEWIMTRDKRIALKEERWEAEQERLLAKQVSTGGVVEGA